MAQEVMLERRRMLQGRVTSEPPSCHLTLGQEAVLYAWESVWLETAALVASCAA